VRASVISTYILENGDHEDASEDERSAQPLPQAQRFVEEKAGCQHLHQQEADPGADGISAVQRGLADQQVRASTLMKPATSPPPTPTRTPASPGWQRTT